MHARRAISRHSQPATLTQAPTPSTVRHQTRYTPADTPLRAPARWLCTTRAGTQAVAQPPPTHARTPAPSPLARPVPTASRAPGILNACYRCSYGIAVHTAAYCGILRHTAAYCGILQNVFMCKLRIIFRMEYLLVYANSGSNTVDILGNYATPY